jgi:hypothetical protein
MLLSGSTCTVPLACRPAGVLLPFPFTPVASDIRVGLRLLPLLLLQVSFVNSICTSKGGTHVNYVVDQITK